MRARGTDRFLGENGYEDPRRIDGAGLVEFRWRTAGMHVRRGDTISGLAAAAAALVVTGIAFWSLYPNDRPVPIRRRLSKALPSSGSDDSHVDVYDAPNDTAGNTATASVSVSISSVSTARVLRSEHSVSRNELHAYG